MKKFQDIEYNYEYDANGNLIPESRIIIWLKQNVSMLLRQLISQSQINNTISPFDVTTKTIEFLPELETICHHLFPLLVYMRNEDEYAAASMASYIFEQFTPFWSEVLLKEGKDILGLRLWEKVLDIIYKWEKSSNAKIHKGTPYFFLAENYFLLGERDLAFHFLLNGEEENRILGTRTKKGNYPWESPGYFFATMREGSQMDPLMRRLRGYLNSFIIDFQTEFSSTFSIQNFDQKFLEDKSLTDIVIFFHYNFLYIYDSHVKTGINYLENDFSRLRGLDLFFNLALVIDEVLKILYLKYNSNLQIDHKMSDSIRWFCDHYNLMNQSDLMDYWGSKLKLKKSNPDTIIPRLLNKSDIYKGNKVPREVFTLLIALKFRNYGAHNIRQQSTVVTRYDDIVKNLLFSLFLSIEKL